MRRIRLRSIAAFAVPLLVLGLVPGVPAQAGMSASAAASTMNALVPEPVEVQPNTAASYQITANTVIYADSAPVGNYLAGILDPSTGYTIPVEQSSGTPGDGIALLLSGRASPYRVGAGMRWASPTTAPPRSLGRPISPDRPDLRPPASPASAWT